METSEGWLCFCGELLPDIQCLHRHAKAYGHRMRCSCGEFFSKGPQLFEHQKNSADKHHGFERVPAIKRFMSEAYGNEHTQCRFCKKRPFVTVQQKEMHEAMVHADKMNEPRRRTNYGSKKRKSEIRQHSTRLGRKRNKTKDDRGEHSVKFGRGTELDGCPPARDREEASGGGFLMALPVRCAVPSSSPDGELLPFVVDLGPNNVAPQALGALPSDKAKYNDVYDDDDDDDDEEDGGVMISLREQTAQMQMK